MVKILKLGLIGLGAFFIIIQFIPSTLPENDDTLSKDMLLSENTPENVKSILTRACYDCHSNQSVIPWYGKLAPASWLVAKDIREGRDKLNFSVWSDLSKRKKIKLLNEIAEEVEEKNMPLKEYTIIHRNAVLSETEIETIVSWTSEMSDKILNPE